MSSFNGSTNFISSGQGSIYTLNTSSITTEYITTQGGILTFSNSDLIPSVDDTYNLGSATNRWRELYVAGTSIHLGNSLVLSEDDNSFLSTNNGIITSNIHVENVSTSFITTQVMEYKSDSLGGITFTINNESATLLGILDNSYDFSIFNIANTNINLTAPNIKITGTLDLSSNEIINIAQTSTISSATTNLCLPTYKFITTTSPTNTYSNNIPFTQIFPSPDYFTHVIPFYNKYRIQLKFSGLLNTLNSLSYFYFELSNNVSPTPVIYQGSIYNATTPYTYNQNVAYNQPNVSFDFMDIFDMRANPPNIDDNLYVLLYALNSCNATNYFTDVNCFIVTEPVV
jgi:hypothetical protein